MYGDFSGPNATYLALRDFVLQCFEDDPIGDLELGIASKTLLRMALDHFCDEDTVDRGIEKGAIANGIKRMADKGILEKLEWDNATLYRLNFTEKCKGGDNGEWKGPCEERRADSGIGWWEGDKENLPLSGGERDIGERDDEVYEERYQEEESTIQAHPIARGEHADMDENEIRSHSEAYANMTRGAAPMPIQLKRTPSIQDFPQRERVSPDRGIETPSRKRRRVREVTASDSTSLQSLSLSPCREQRGMNSTPRRRPLARMFTPNSEVRRRSVPTGACKSPALMNELRDVEEHNVGIKLKQEKKAVSDISSLTGNHYLNLCH